MQSLKPAGKGPQASWQLPLRLPFALSLPLCCLVAVLMAASTLTPGHPGSWAPSRPCAPCQDLPHSCHKAFLLLYTPSKVLYQSWKLLYGGSVDQRGQTPGWLFPRHPNTRVSSVPTLLHLSGLVACPTSPTAWEKSCPYCSGHSCLPLPAPFWRCLPPVLGAATRLPCSLRALQPAGSRRLPST